MVWLHRSLPWGGGGWFPRSNNFYLPSLHVEEGGRGSASWGGTTCTGDQQGGKSWILPNEKNANRFFWDSHWLEIQKNEKDAQKQYANPLLFDLACRFTHIWPLTNVRHSMYTSWRRRSAWWANQSHVHLLYVTCTEGQRWAKLE